MASSFTLLGNDSSSFGLTGDCGLSFVFLGDGGGSSFALLSSSAFIFTESFSSAGFPGEDGTDFVSSPPFSELDIFGLKSFATCLSFSKYTRFSSFVNPWQRVLMLVLSSSAFRHFLIAKPIPCARTNGGVIMSMLLRSSFRHSSARSESLRETARSRRDIIGRNSSSHSSKSLCSFASGQFFSFSFFFSILRCLSRSRLRARCSWWACSFSSSVISVFRFFCRTAFFLSLFFEPGSSPSSSSSDSRPDPAHSRKSSSFSSSSEGISSFMISSSISTLGASISTLGESSLSFFRRFLLFLLRLLLDSSSSSSSSSTSLDFFRFFPFLLLFPVSRSPPFFLFFFFFVFLLLSSADFNGSSSSNRSSAASSSSGTIAANCSYSSSHPIVHSSLSSGSFPRSDCISSNALWCCCSVFDSDFLLSNFFCTLGGSLCIFRSTPTSYGMTLFAGWKEYAAPISVWGVPYQYTNRVKGLFDFFTFLYMVNHCSLTGPGDTSYGPSSTAGNHVFDQLEKQSCRKHALTSLGIESNVFCFPCSNFFLASRY
mmetsp:Transcript_26310/g.77796  ORF Transcript_26310/g.77796 Transcript_26310/m.77796 type:complete len:542 (+) Transcript_26310:962-2587(+)